MAKQSFWQKITGGIKKVDEYEEYYEEDEFIDENISEQYYDNANENEAPQEETINDSDMMELPVDIYQDNDNIYIESFIPGVPLSVLNIELARDLITIQGERQSSSDTENITDFFYQELKWGAFTRSIVLPEEVDIDSAEAVEVNGVLKIKLPKFNKARKAKLDVKSLKS